MLTILKPFLIGKHEGSCFRELLDLWHENNFCRVVPNYDIGDPKIEETQRPQARPWAEGFGNILLYDNTILDKLFYIQGWNKALFANEVLHKEKCSNWIFWSRFPRKYYKFQYENNYKKYDDRLYESIFIGNMTTPKRQGDWMNHITRFIMGNISNNNMNNMLYSYEKYLSNLLNSRFGLCLPGTGPKCLRDVEYMGLGTVPILTSGCSTDYYNLIEENKHYLYAPNPSDIPNVIKNCGKDKWEYMSNECLKWFEKNSSLKGSYDTTIEIIESII